MSPARLLLCFALTALLAAGCKTECDEACRFGADCLRKVDPQTALTDAQVADCISECDRAGTCGSEEKKQAFLDCVVSMRCESRGGATGEILSCMYKCPDAPMGELMTFPSSDAGTPGPDAG